MVALVKAGVELAFETMVNAGIRSESAYYESLHELPLIATTDLLGPEHRLHYFLRKNDISHS